MIDGVTLSPLKQIFDERGKVMHMLRADSPAYTKFGEVYFSSTHPGVVKAWHLHKEMVLNYAVIFGQIKIVLYDDRSESSTCGEIQEIFLSPENYMLLTVPPLIWNGFKSIGPETSIIANCASIPHSDDELIRREPTDSDIPYNWNLQHR
ncbi:dTDP-4-dehydrorhamnose 3,5-epimerase family protein [Candidatus Pseudothioglobus singularis]|nr:dTDP-4-dehydrorhamnose 3,5-epimerase family protein [Candidatus Pseudothioglobus singularis]